uniref:Ig-like domain-containing protein n=1 Tax=Sparus aurata TaxID=8175 RepID=A0A671XM26_SPAAU
MLIAVCCITLNVILVSGNRMEHVMFDLFLDQVHQTPADMFKQPGEEAKITCIHTISTFDRILWYKQTNIQLQLLGYMVGDSEFPEKTGEEETVKIEGNANKDKNCTLTIEGLKLNSSAVYFCAARLHSATYCRGTLRTTNHPGYVHPGLNTSNYSDSCVGPVAVFKLKNMDIIKHCLLILLLWITGEIYPQHYSL